MRRTGDVLQDGAYLIDRQNHRQAQLSLRPHDVVYLWHRVVQNVSVEEQESTQRLILRGCTDVAIQGQTAQEGFTSSAPIELG
jgi:hypothetical protein